MYFTRCSIALTLAHKENKQFFKRQVDSWHTSVGEVSIQNEVPNNRLVESPMHVDKQINTFVCKSEENKNESPIASVINFV